jgi:hypothetical protein
MTTVERSCANCGGWDRSSEEWEHTQWKDHLYRQVIEDIEHDEAQRETVMEERGGKLTGGSMPQASCLGLGWGKWGCCNWNFGRGKVILCWDEKRGHDAPLYRHLVTAHDFCCIEWQLKVERGPTINRSLVLEEATEIMRCPGCEGEIILYLQRHMATGQEYWKGECKSCKVQWVRS